VIGALSCAGALGEAIIATGGSIHDASRKSIFQNKRKPFQSTTHVMVNSNRLEHKVNGPDPDGTLINELRMMPK
jgi:hypothetical protein